jgi:hypothetical protein
LESNAGVFVRGVPLSQVQSASEKGSTFAAFWVAGVGVPTGAAEELAEEKAGAAEAAGGGPETGIVGEFAETASGDGFVEAGTPLVVASRKRKFQVT